MKGIPPVIRRSGRSALSWRPLRLVGEQVAKELGRRYPDKRLLRKLEFEVSAALCAADDVQRVAVLANGARLVVPVWHEVGRLLYYFGSRNLSSGWLYEPETTRFFCNWLRPGDVFLDIGANLGYYTLLASQIVGPNGACHAFEPNEHLVALSRSSVNLNEAGKYVFVNQLAVADHTGSIDFYVPLNPKRDARSSVVAGSYEGDVRKCGVNSIALDDYVAQQGFNSIRLIKIDVEGAEDLVLAGGREVLTKIRPDAVVLEHAPEVLGTPEAQWERVCGMMSSAGYAPFVIDPQGNVRPLGIMAPSQSVQNVCFVCA